MKQSKLSSSPDEPVCDAVEQSPASHGPTHQSPLPDIAKSSDSQLERTDAHPAGRSSTTIQRTNTHSSGRRSESSIRSLQSMAGRSDSKTSSRSRLSSTASSTASNASSIVSRSSRRSPRVLKKVRRSSVAASMASIETSSSGGVTAPNEDMPEKPGLRSRRSFPWTKPPKGESHDQLLQAGFFTKATVMPKRKLTRLPVLQTEIAKFQSNAKRPMSMVATPVAFYSNVSESSGVSLPDARPQSSLLEVESGGQPDSDQLSEVWNAFPMSQNTPKSSTLGSYWAREHLQNVSPGSIALDSMKDCEYRAEVPSIFDEPARDHRSVELTIGQSKAESDSDPHCEPQGASLVSAGAATHKLMTQTQPSLLRLEESPDRSLRIAATPGQSARAIGIDLKYDQQVEYERTTHGDLASTTIRNSLCNGPLRVDGVRSSPADSLGYARLELLIANNRKLSVVQEHDENEELGWTDTGLPPAREQGAVDRPAAMAEDEAYLGRGCLDSTVEGKAPSCTISYGWMPGYREERLEGRVETLAGQGSSVPELDETASSDDSEEDEAIVSNSTVSVARGRQCKAARSIDCRGRAGSRQIQHCGSASSTKTSARRIYIHGKIEIQDEQIRFAQRMNVRTGSIMAFCDWDDEFRMKRLVWEETSWISQLLDDFEAFLPPPHRTVNQPDEDDKGFGDAPLGPAPDRRLIEDIAGPGLWQINEAGKQAEDAARRRARALVSTRSLRKATPVAVQRPSLASLILRRNIF